MVEKMSHDTELLTLGKGIVKFDRYDANGLPTGLRDMGNAPSFNLTIETERIEHTTSREGINTIDWTRTKLRRLKGDFELDEFGRENLRLYLFGKTGTFSIAPLTSGDLLGKLDFWPMNDIGPKYHFEGYILLSPKGSLGLISDDLGKYGFDFEAQNNENDVDFPYGKLTLIEES